ncbi:helix-turn-helix domain-containing protein [Mucilaginibacter sp. AW1-7]|uniref:helix-turn-helix domain-containing protein n=1 Tax=Mucilaginibacter sp. AW1-7 TaxID=3349874 RepID=UPI003F732430
MKDFSEQRLDQSRLIKDSPSIDGTLNRHRGKVVECVVRRHPMGLSEIARRVGISRRTLYNWFENEMLACDLIGQLGNVIEHDFTAEFPGEGDKIKMARNEQLTGATRNGSVESPVHYWMNKYIELLERYNQILQAKKGNGAQNPA